MKKQYILSAFVALAMSMAPNAASAQKYPMLLHSHNDYTRAMPFYEAYSQHFFSVECDMFYKDGKFLVGHDLEDLRDDITFERMYVEPLVNVYNLNGGKPFADSDDPFQLVVEIKSDDPYAYLDALVKILKQHADIFDPTVNPHACRIVVTGNVPPAKDFARWPSYVTFDGDLRTDYTAEQLKQVGMISTCFSDYSHWNGKGTLIAPEKAKIEEIISKVHAMGKPVRFWGAPESITAYVTFFNMGVDYFNSDHPAQCAEFFKNWKSMSYMIGDKNHSEHRVITNDRLDKITKNFSGFQDDKMQLKESQPTYTPTYLNDGADKKVKNVILLIGDGMGLAEVVATERVNGALTMFNMKHMGISETTSADAFTTDSAAGGSALATGKKNNNRHISAAPDGTPYPTLTDYFSEQGKTVGVVSLGNAADATPAAFYAHNTERDSADAITADLLKSPIRLLAGSGINEFTNRHDGKDLIKELAGKGFRFARNIDDINASEGKVICIDEEMGAGANVDNLDYLARTTRESIKKLQEGNKNGFFLMVEGAKIDYAGHSQYFPGCILETLSFDKAIAEALKFADSNGETLVIVTADHETGGLNIVDGINETHKVYGHYLTNDHTAITVPVFAYGPQSQRFIGKQQNTDINLKIKAATAKKK